MAWRSTRVSGLSAFAVALRDRYAGDEPAAADTGTTRKSRPGTVCSISSPTVPCPATMRASS